MSYFSLFIFIHPTHCGQIILPKASLRSSLPKEILNSTLRSILNVTSSMAFSLTYTLFVLSPSLSYPITFCVCVSLCQLSYPYSYLCEKACRKREIKNFSKNQYDRNEYRSPMIIVGMLYLYKLSTTVLIWYIYFSTHFEFWFIFLNVRHQDWTPLIIQRLCHPVRFLPIWKMTIWYKTAVRRKSERRHKTQYLYPITVLWTLNWISEEKQLSFALSGNCPKGNLSSLWFLKATQKPSSNDEH